MNDIGHPLLPWQKVAAIRGGEMIDGTDCAPALGAHSATCLRLAGKDPGSEEIDITAVCRPRFRVVLIIVARQNGKTELPVGLSLFWQFKQRLPLIVGTSTKLAYAKESWRKAVNLAKRTRSLDDLHMPGAKWYRLTNGEVESWSLPNDQGHECRYLIATANADGGRSLTINRGITDELRMHRTYEAWDAFEPACSPPDAQIWAMSNAGDARSVVLNDLQDSARDFIDTGVGDERLGLLEWSAPDDADPEDLEALLQANPRVGYGLDLDTLIAAGQRAKRLGGQALTGFLTERMCVRVAAENPALNPRAWEACKDPGDLLDVRSRVVLCLHLTPDADRATLAAAAVLDDGRVRVETVAEWTGARSAASLERDLPGWVERVRPRAVGWFPSGPGAAVASRLADRRKAGVRGWPPRGVAVAEIRSEVPAVCMGLAKEVDAGLLAHSGQEMLDKQVGRAEKARQGSAWVFAQGGGPVDAVYAVAGAVHLARTLPKPRKGTGFHSA